MISTERNRFFLYPMMSALPACLLVFSWLYAICSVTSYLFYPIWIPAVLLVPAFIETVIWNSLQQRSTLEHRLGEVFILPVAFYCFYSLFIDKPFLYRFSLGYGNFLFAVPALFVWIFTFLNHRCFFFAEKFDGKSDNLRMEYGSTAALSITRYLFLVRLQLVLSWCAFIFAALFGVKDRIWNILFGALLTAIFYFLIHQARHIRDRFEYFEDRIDYSEKAASGNRATTVLLAAAGLVAAVLGAGGRALLPLRSIVMFMFSIFRHVPREMSKDEIAELGQNEVNPIPDFEPHIPAEGNDNSPLRFVPLLIVVIIAAFLVYTAGQLLLFIRYRRVQLKEYRWRDVLKKGFREFLKAVAGFFSEFGAFLFRKRSAGQWEMKEDAAAKLRKMSRVTARSEEKEKEMDDVLSLYVKIIRWGNRHGVPWSFMMPLDYNLSLKKKFPGLSENLDYAVKVYNESMYSDHLLEAAVLKRYRSAVKTIIKTRNKNGRAGDERPDEV